MFFIFANRVPGWSTPVCYEPPGQDSLPYGSGLRRDDRRIVVLNIGRRASAQFQPMLTQLTLLSERLLLRPFHPHDENDLQHLASQHDIADTMISLPHPYPDGHAQRCIVRYTEDFYAGRAAHFAITLKASGQLIGSIELRDIDREHLQAELSLWVTPPQWGRGYATEAAGSVLPYGFQQLGLNRIYAYHLTRNAASGRVLEKAGFQREGLLRQRVRKWDVFEDVVALALLREQWLAKAKEPLCKNT